MLPTEDLNAHEMETLTHHILSIRHHNLSPSRPRIVRFDQTRNVTWLRLVRGSWLLVAASDKKASSLSLWKLSDILQNGSDASPLSEAFLPAPVRDDAIDVEDGTLRVAV